MFRARRAHHQERQILPIQPLVTVTLCWWPFSVQFGSKLISLPEVVLIKFVSLDDEHDVLETCS